MEKVSSLCLKSGRVGFGTSACRDEESVPFEIRELFHRRSKDRCIALDQPDRRRIKVGTAKRRVSVKGSGCTGGFGVGGVR